MRDISRQSIYRIIYDMMRADELISNDEIAFVREMCSKYDITPELREQAMSMTLSEAFGELRTMPVRQLASFMSELSQLSLSDGSCCREEALLLLACRECLTGDKTGTLVSLPSSDIMLNDNQVLFVENGYDEGMNGFILANYSYIVNHFKVGDFDFVYLPKMVEHLSSAGTLLHDMIYYLSPSQGDDKADAIAKSLKDMTSESLFRELILGKLGFDFDIHGPSIIVRIGASMAHDNMMVHYLIVPLKKDVLGQVDDMISHFMKCQNSTSFVIRNKIMEEDRIVYSGFYRTLFDLLTYRQGASSRLVVHPYNRKNVLTVVTRTVDGETDEPLDIGPKESAFYVFLISETLHYGGFNIAANGLNDVKYLEAAQHRFETTYLSLATREVAPDITDADIRRPMLSKIRKAIEEHPHIVQRMTFMPETTKEKVIKVHLRDVSYEI
ncbi:MAG: hypothetical protein J5663_11140 [Bacteroidaceae bacterium]|nr:hypothetical protein [Bacteroidaceae bacterium]